MGKWSIEELLNISEADDLHISPFREDGVTYRAKYKGSPYLNSMISARARSATVRVLPQEANA